MTRENRVIVVTERQRIVIGLVAQGLSNGEIGLEVYCTEETIKTMLRRLFRKFKARGRAQLVTKAIQAGVLDVHNLPKLRLNHSKYRNNTS